MNQFLKCQKFDFIDCVVTFLLLIYRI